MVDDVTRRLAQANVIDAGFRPARFSRLVRLVRRVLWPLIRPFHFQLLDSILALSTDTGERINRVRDEMAAELAAVAERAKRANAATRDALVEFVRPGDLVDLAKRDELTVFATRDELAHVVAQLDIQRAEQAALVNRHTWLDATLADVSGDVRNVRTHFDGVQANLESAVDSARDHLSVLGARQTESERRLEQASKLFLSMTQGGIFLLLRGELISDLANGSGHWDQHVLRLAASCQRAAIGRNAAANLVAVDAGAHFGLISIPLARIFGRVISFEPNEFNHRILLANAALNGLSGQVEARQDGLSSTVTTLSLAPSERQEIPLPLDATGHLEVTRATNLGAYSFIQNGSGLSETRAYPLDSLGLANLAFMKIDVQGADGEVLMGALETIGRCHPWLVFEWEAHLSEAFSVSFDDVAARLAGFGYAVRVLRRHNEKQTDYAAVPNEDLAALQGLLGEAQTA